MSFKTDTSFLRFLSMGAAGVCQTMKQLEEVGFRPIELERYCGSNKIWATKVKRLRLPDLLCVETGLRVEVRAKSNLKIRMSDAPSNPDRVWDAGLRDDDLIAFIACFDITTKPEPADRAVFFTVKSLRDSVALSKLGPPKSASEGAERDRTWPATIPKRDGTVLDVNAEKLVVQLSEDGGPARRQTYRLNGKNSYVAPGDGFTAEVSILAGAPKGLAKLTDYLHRVYDPLADLHALSDVDRYAAAKALPYRPELHERAVLALEALLSKEKDDRVALEAAGSATVLGSQPGEAFIKTVLREGRGRADLRMEAVLILTELGSAFAHDELKRIAEDERLVGDEIREAAVWGLGKTGLKAYTDILSFIDDEDENVALHAITAFGPDTPRPVIESLVCELRSESPRRAAAASEALRIIGNNDVLEVVTAEARHAGPGSDWVLATLGRLPVVELNRSLTGDPLLERIAPMTLLSGDRNWLATEEIAEDVLFLLKQDL